MSKAGTTTVDPVLAELISIKRLLVFSLLHSGANQKQVAAALGVDQSQVSRMLSSSGTGTKRRTRKGG